jgi:hypothetical protein
MKPSGMKPPGMKHEGMKPSGMKLSGMKPSGMKPSGMKHEGWNTRDETLRDETVVYLCTFPTFPWLPTMTFCELLLDMISFREFSVLGLLLLGGIKMRKGGKVGKMWSVVVVMRVGGGGDWLKGASINPFSSGGACKCNLRYSAAKPWRSI